jgi:hypothetical protein
VAARVLVHARGEEESVLTVRLRPLLVGTFFAGLGVWIGMPLAWLVLIGALTGGKGAGATCGACVFALLLIAGWTPMMAVLFVIGRWTRARANRHASRVASEIDLTVAARCPSCGAHIQQLCVGYGGEQDCPWCESVLVAPESVVSALKAAEQALLQSRTGRAREAWDTLLGSIRESASRPRAGGLTFAAAVWTGNPTGLSVWCAEDHTGRGVLRQLEIDTPLALSGATWLFPAKNKAHRQLAADFGLPEAKDEGGAAPLCNHHLLGADAARLADVATIGALAEALGPHEAVLFEPAGLSLWRLSPSPRQHMKALPKPWLQERVPLLTAVAAACRQGGT